MGLLGGDDGTSGWGVMPPPMSSNDWGSSAGTASSTSSLPVSSSGGAGGNGNGSTSGSGVNHWQSTTTSSSSSIVGSGSVSNNSGGPLASSSAAAAPGSSLSGNGQAGNANSNNSNNMQPTVSSAACRIQQSNNNSTQQQSGPGGELSSSPKLSSSWAQAAGKGLGLSTGPAGSGGSSGQPGMLHQSATLSHEVSSSQQQQQSAIGGGQPGSSPASAGILGSNVVGGLSSVGGGVGGHNPSLVMNNANDAISNQSAGGPSMLGAGGVSAPGQSHHQATSNPIDVALPASHKAAWSTINKQGSVSSTSIADVVGHVTEELRQTLLTDNWTNSVINHDSPWDIAPSPLSSPKDSSTWRCPAKAGTEIWENNVRQKKGGVGGGMHQAVGVGGVGGGHQMPGQLGQPGSVGGMNSVSAGVVGGGNGGGVSNVGGMPSQSGGPNAGMSQPWQTPSSNIGGTWGEDEDTSNHWNPVQSGSAGQMAPVGPVGGPGSNQVPSAGGGMGGMNGMSGLGNQNFSSINNTWSGSTPMVNGAGQSGQSQPGTSNYPLLPPGGNGGNNFVPNNSNMSWTGDKNALNEPRNKNNWGNFDESNDQQWERNNAESSFGTWNAEPKRDSWDKDSNESYKGVDDGTAGWGVRQKNSSQPNANWKPEQNKYGNSNNNNGNNNKNPSNGFNQPGGNGWNSSANNNQSNNGKNSYMMQRSWTNDGPGMHAKSQQMWNPQGTRSPNGTNNWGDGQIDTSQWGDSRPKQISREMVQTSKQYRALCDQGFKPNQVESALRNQNMNYDGALAELKALQDYGMKNPMNQGFNGPMRQNKSNSFGGNSIYGNQYGHQNNPQGQVKQMIDRIQSAVNAGYLNAQILNQSLSNQDLELVSELLYKINELQQFQNEHAYVHGASKKEMDEKVNQMKIAISNLQTRLTMGPMVNMKSLDMNTSSQHNAPGSAFGPGNGPSGGPQAGNGYQMPGAGSRIHQWTRKNNQQQPQQPPQNEFPRAPGPSLNKPSGGNWGFDSGPLNGPDQWNQEFSLVKSEKHFDEYSPMNTFQSPVDQFDHKWKGSGFGKGLTDDVDPRSPISNTMLKQESIFPGQSWSRARDQSSKSFNNPQPQMDPFVFDSNSSSLWSFNSNSNGAAPAPSMMGQQPQMFDMPKKSLGGKPGGVNQPTSGWNAQGINTGADFGTGEPSLWGSVPGGSKPRPPPPGLSKNQSIWNSNTPVNDYGMGMPRGMAPQVDYNY